MKKLIAICSLLFSITAHATSPTADNPNFGFELGTTANWTISNGTGTSKAATSWSSNGVGVTTTPGITNYSPGGGKTWNISPYGSHMMAIQAGSGSPVFNTAATSMGLNNTEITAIRNYLTGLGGNSTPTNASWASRTVALQAGITYTVSWNYLSTDYTPFNDGSMMTVTHSTNAGITPVLNNSTQRYALLGFTNPGTGNYATGSYGSTGWQVATIVVPTDGTYTLGFSSFNLGDTSLSPILLVDDLQGNTQLNGQTFGPVAPNAGSTAPPPPPPGPPPPPPPPALCCGGSSASFAAESTKLAKVNQFKNRTTADSMVYIDQIGNSNTITVKQSGTNQNYVDYAGNGSFNTVNVTQSGNASTQVNFVELTVGSTNAANSNTVNVTQTSTGGTKAVFADVSGSSNSLTVQQTGSGSHWADVTLTGGNKTVNVTQTGTAGHMANINLGGSATALDLTQSGTTQQHYSITHTCAIAGGCGPITVTQGQ
jgi:fibronectin-binding autotransporter adhesin